MCVFKVKSPNVSQIDTPATDLLPQTNSVEPESPVYGSESPKKKGRNALKIDLNSTGTTNSTGLNI